MSKVRTYAFLLAGIASLGSGVWRVSHGGYSATAMLSFAACICWLLAAFALKDVTLRRG